MQEFFNQGDTERAVGIKISPFMDRRKPELGKCQAGFLDFLAVPLFELVEKHVWRSADRTGIDALMGNLRSNREMWVELQAKEEKAKAGPTPLSPSFPMRAVPKARGGSSIVAE
jgi:hypothetical protein